MEGAKIQLCLQAPKKGPGNCREVAGVGFFVVHHWFNMAAKTGNVDFQVHVSSF